MRLVKTLACLHLLLASLSSQATLLYDNSRYDFTCCATGSDFDLPLQIADGLGIAATGNVLVTSIYWTGSYTQATGPVPDDFTIRFFHDDDGRPSVNAFASTAIGNSATRTDWGGNRFSYLASIDPVLLSPATPYYISIIADTRGFESDWFWFAEDFPVGASRFDRVQDNEAWSGNGLRNYVFNLYGELAPVQAVPEPSTALVLCFGVAALSVLRGRRKASAVESRVPLTRVIELH